MCAWRVCQGQLLMQAFIPTATTVAEKCTLFLVFNKVGEMHFISRLDAKYWTRSVEREMKVKGTGSRCLLGECVKDNYCARFHLHSYHCCREMNFISRLDINFLDSTQNIDKVSGAWNEGQGYRVKVPTWRVCQGQLLCKVSSSQLTLLQRNELYF